MVSPERAYHPEHSQTSFQSLHAELQTAALEVNANDSYSDVLMELHFGRGVFDKVVGEFADMYKSFGMDTHVDKAAEVGDVGDDAWQHHADLHIFQFFDIFGKFED